MVKKEDFLGDGIVRGGLLYEEPERVVKSRRRVAFGASLFFFALGLIFIAAVLSYSKRPDIVPFDLFALAFVATACFLVGVLALCRWRGEGSLRIYEHGILPTIAKRSFFRFKDIRYIEEERTAKDEPFTTVTTVSLMTFDFRPAILRDYEKVKEIINKRIQEDGAESMQWDNDAMEFVMKLDGSKGPVVVATEKAARRKGLSHVSIGFIASDWSCISKELGGMGYSFKKAAKRRFHDQGNRPAPIKILI